jgi:hypothetical protein
MMRKATRFDFSRLMHEVTLGDQDDPVIRTHRGQHFAN